MGWTSFPNEVYAYIMTTEGWRNESYRLGAEPYYSIGVGHLCDPNTKSATLGNIVPGVSGDQFNAKFNGPGNRLTDEQVLKLLKADIMNNMGIWANVQGNYSVQVQAVMASLAHFGPAYAKRCIPFLNRGDLNGMKETYLGCYRCKDKRFEAHHKRAREIQWETMMTGKWKDSHGNMSDDAYLAYLNKMMAQLGSEMASNGEGYAGGDSSSGGAMQAGGGVSKFWYLGAAHNILNNAQLEKLYLEVKLRGCNLSILRGEKVPVLMIDNRHKNALAEMDNAIIDPTTMMDTWASGWFMIGGYSYIYDPQENSNVNKWTTIMKLQRMEWPTPTEVTDPSARMVRTIRYNIGLGKEFAVDDIGGIEGGELEDPATAKIGVSDCSKRIQDLVSLMDKAGINYRIVSAKRYPIDENGNIVKKDDGLAVAKVKFGNAYAFKCANGIRFFTSPISDHSIGDAIDIIQADGENFNKVLSDIISSDDILIHMINNYLALYEETSTDDLGAATSHFHIGTNVTLGNNRATIFKNWWAAVEKVRGASSIKGFSFKQAAAKATSSSDTKTVQAANAWRTFTSKGYVEDEWILRKIYSTDDNWMNSKFGAREISYDDWVEKAQAALKADYKTGNKTAGAINGADAKTASDSSSGTNSSVNPNPKKSLYENTGVSIDSAETANLPADVLKDPSTWERYGNDCVVAWENLDKYYKLYQNKQDDGLTGQAALDALKDLKKAAANIKVILDANPSSELIADIKNNAEKLQKRNELDTKYRNSLSLIEKVEAAIQKENAQILLNSENTGGGEEGSKVTNIITDLGTGSNQSDGNTVSGGSSDQTGNTVQQPQTTTSGSLDEDKLYQYIVATLSEAEGFYNKYTADLERNVIRYKLDLWNSGIKYDNMGKITIGSGRFKNSIEIIKYFNNELGGSGFWISWYDDKPSKSKTFSTITTFNNVYYEHADYPVNKLFAFPVCAGYLYFYIYNDSNSINKFNKCIETVETALGLKDIFTKVQLLDMVNIAGRDITKVTKVNEYKKADFILDFYKYKSYNANTEISVKEYNKSPESDLHKIIMEFTGIKPYI